MSVELSARARAVEPSPTLALAAKAKALRAQGQDIVGFAAGEPDFDTPAFIKEAAVRALAQGQTKYTPTAGIVELRGAIGWKLRRDVGLEYRPEEILVSCGAKHSLYNLCQALLEDGAEAVIPSPYWVSYPEMVRLAGAAPVFAACREEDGFVLSAAALERALSPRTRLVVLNSPNNPTGVVLPRKTLGEIGELLASRPGILIATDDIYERLIYTGEPFANILQAAPSLRERTVIVNGVSKTFAMTGWRIGWAAGPAELIAAMGRIQDQTTSGPTTFAQWGALAALTGPSDEVERMRGEFDRRRRRLLALLHAIPGVSCVEPAGAFYAFPNVEALLRKKLGGGPVGTDGRLCELLLERGVAAVPGAPFGAPGHLRLSFALSLEELEKGVARIAALAAELT
ncbi:MAG: pyridoxal phosphate-dependent aminotransferase [Myxococcales bacterium]